MKFGRRIFVAFALVTFMASGALAAPSGNWADFADTSWWIGHEDDSIFTISTPAQLAGLAVIVNSEDSYPHDGSNFSGKTVKLSNDIDLSAHYWNPIGIWNVHAPFSLLFFSGVFDGDGKKITGLNIAENGGAEGTGLFASLSTKGAIKNVHVWGTVSGDRVVGGIVGGNYGGTIANCAFSGDVKGGDNVGGVIGNNHGTVDNCDFSGNVLGNGNVGGVVGTNYSYYDLETVTALVTNCENKGKVSGKTIVGGVVGWNGGRIEKTKNTGNVFLLDGIAMADSNTAGGIVGMNSSHQFYVDIKGTLDNCSNAGDVSGNSGSVWVGGVAGMNSALIMNCSNEGLISGDDDVGGIVGRNLSFSDPENSTRGLATVTNSHNFGKVVGGGAVGGVIGSNSGSTLANSSNTAEVSGGLAIGGIVGANYSHSGEPLIGNVENCLNSGKVSANGAWAGGVIGLNSGVVRNCANTGEVLGTGNNDAQIGGVVGASVVYFFEGENVLIENCSNTGEVTGSSLVGGVVGNNFGYSKVKNSSNSGKVSADTYYGAGGVIGVDQQTSSPDITDTFTNCEWVRRDGGAENGIGSNISVTYPEAKEVSEDKLSIVGVIVRPAYVKLTSHGQQGTLSADVHPISALAAKRQVTWTSGNAGVATVAQTKAAGTTAATAAVTSVAGGSTAITVTTNDDVLKGGDTNKKWSMTASVDVVIPVTRVTLNKTATLLDVGGEEKLTATIEPSDATNKDVTWSTTNASIASVDQTGLVRANGGGKATIIVSSDAYPNIAASCEITVIVPVTGVSLNKPTTSLTAGGMETLVATVTPDNATNKAVTWSSSTPTVATVSGDTVTGRAVGSATITVTTADGGFTATCIVTVTNPGPVVFPVTGVTLNKTSTAFKVGNTEQLTATVAPTNATNKAVSWTSSNTSVATVSNGLITGVAAGSATITVTSVADASKTATCTVTITAVDPVKPPVEPKPVKRPDVVEIGTEAESPTPEKMEAATDAGKIDESIKDNKDLKDAMDTLTETATNGKKYPKLDEVKRHVDEDINKDTMQQLESFALTLDEGKSFLVVTNALRLSFDVTFDKIVIVKILADKTTKQLTMKFDGVLEKDGEFTIVSSADQTKIVTAAEKPKKGEDYIVSWMIGDNAACDLDKTPGKILDPAVIAEKMAVDPKDPKGGGGGCSAAHLPFALIFAVPLFFRRKR